MVHAKEVIEIRGEPIKVDAEYFTCTECGEEFENTRCLTELPLKNKEEVYYYKIFQNFYGKLGIANIVGRTNVY